MDHTKSIIQNQDVNVGPAFFKPNAEKDELLVHSIFSTLQGEMPYAGYPAVFLRLGGCNRGQKNEAFACQSCDTNFKVKESKSLPVEEVAQLVLSKFSDFGKFHTVAKPDAIGFRPLLVISGGEPLLQQSALSKLFHAIGERTFFATAGEESYPFRGVTSFYGVQFETNGDYAPSEELMRAMNDARSVATHRVRVGSISFVVSPKEPHGKKPWWLTTQDYADKYGSHFFLRRVVNAEPFSLYHELPPQIFASDIPNEHIFLSPTTVYSSPVKDPAKSFKHVDLEESQLNMNYAVSLCKLHGFRLSSQTHVFLNIE